MIAEAGDPSESVTMDKLYYLIREQGLLSLHLISLHHNS